MYSYRVVMREGNTTLTMIIKADDMENTFAAAYQKWLHDYQSEPESISILILGLAPTE